VRSWCIAAAAWGEAGSCGSARGAAHNPPCRLLYGLYEYLFRKDIYHVLILGVDSAGKTNVLERLKTIYTALVGLDPGKILPTVGLNVGRLDAAGQSMVFWDLGGQTGLRAIWDKYFDESHAVIYVVDAAKRERFDESRKAYERVLQARQLSGAPVLVMANKQDLQGVADVEELGQMFAPPRDDTSRAFKVMPVCAYTGQGLRESVDWLIQNIRASPRTQRLRVKANR
jgi:ADP-ribosylation factor related protein 1